MSSVERRPKVGIVLGGGGLKCFAAIALFEFLDETEIEIDLLAGCSGGGIAAAARGAGFSPAEMRNLIEEFADREIFSSIDYRTLLGLAHLPFGRFDKGAAILKADRLRQAYQQVFKDLKLEDLHPTILLQTTDILTGEGIVLSQGPVTNALCATTALFPLLPPVCIEGRWLIDGAYSSLVPVMEAVNHNMDVIIVFSVSTQSAANPGGFFEYFSNLINRTQIAHVRQEMALAIDLHHHEIVIVNVPFYQDIQMWDVEKVPVVLETGQKVVEQKKKEILLAIASFSAKQEESDGY
jgi:NTE family protein